MKGITILYEDQNFLILNKPAGLPVQGGRGIENSLDSLLAMNRKQRPLLVHRLDKDTSGVIVTAKTRETAAACSALFSKEKEGLKKTYFAICAGKLDKTGTIYESLLIKGKVLKAETSYTCNHTASIGIPGEPDNSLYISLAEILPSTGRMHQIRRHLAQKGRPVLGDDKYGDFALNKKLKKHCGIKRLLLHAFSIYLPPSLIKGGLEVSAPLPDYFLDVIKMAGINY